MILGIYCAGNLGRELVDLARRINNITKRWEDIVFVDEQRLEREYYDVKVCKLEDLSNQRENVEFVIANGTPVNREKIFNRVRENKYRMGDLIDPTAIISNSAVLKKNSGIIITAYSSISSNVCIKENVLIQPYVRVPHDVNIGAHCVLSSNASLGGRISIGKNTFIGLGASLRENIVIGDDVIIGMGANVVSDISPRTINIGNPSKMVGKNITGQIF